MAIREIITVPNPILRKKARKVTVFDRQSQKQIDDMVDTMRSAPGVGLAAPQMSISYQIIVLEYGNEEQEIPTTLYIVANPEAVRESHETEFASEGCLSVPGLEGEVERPLKITVKGLNRKGDPIKIKAEGWLARIFLHEIDHLKGILFTDRAIKVWEVDEVVGQSSIGLESKADLT